MTCEDDAGYDLDMERYWHRMTALGTALLLLALGTVSGARDTGATSTPWSAEQALAPAALAATIRSGEPPPTIVYVGYKPLFRPGHIPGATFHGPASQPEGLADLKGWAATQPRDRVIVVYCGCCPLDDCPNVAAAYTALTQLGFTHVKVLIVPASFQADWVEKGYRIER